MTLKAFFLSLLLALIVAAATAVLVLAGTGYFHKQETHSSVKAIFSMGDQERDISYVEVKNLIITLKSRSHREHYLLMDLAFATRSEEKKKQIEKTMPAMKSTLVDMFSSMEYKSVQEIPVEKLRQDMMVRYQQVYGTGLPFDDVLISKMLFH